MGRSKAVCPTGSGKSLGLVTKALLVAIGLHALAALMLADLGLPTLFEVAHSINLVGFEFCGFLKPQFREICCLSRRRSC